MRGLATTVSNPRTEAQLNQRAKFSTVLKFIQPITSFIRVGFKNYAVGMTAFNAAMSYNLQNAIKGIYPAYEIDYNKVLVSRGSLPGALNPVAASTVTGKVDFTWDNNSFDAGASDDDKALLVIYNPLRQKALTLVDGATRTMGTQTVTLPETFSGEQVHCYLGFQDASQSFISDSAYVGTVLVA